MKILVLTNLYPPDVLGGYELACRQVVSALRARGHEVRVLSSAPRKAVPPSDDVRRVFRVHDIYDPSIHHDRQPLACRLRLGHAALIDSFNVHALIREVEDFRPDVAYLWNVLGVGGLGLLAAVQHLGVPWVWHLMDDVPPVLCLSKFGIVHPEASRYLTREFQDQADGLFLACSRGLVDEIEGQGVSLQGRLAMLSNWVTARGRADRDDYMPDGVLRLVSAGSLSRVKGVDIAIRAASLLRQKGHENFRLDIHGIGKEREFRMMIQKEGLTDHVFLMGQKSHDELLGLFANYDMFLFPTWAREPFGMAPLEAAAFGCVPVLSQRCGISEWLLDGVHCFKAPRTAEGFAGVLADVLEGRKELGSIGRRASAVVSHDFHLDNVIGSIERHLVGQAARRRAPSMSSEDLYRLAVLAEKYLICQLQRPSAA